MRVDNFIMNCPCPYCGNVIDSVASQHKQDGLPITGDFNVCVRCGGISCFEVENGVISLRKTATKDLNTLQEKNEEGYAYLLMVKRIIIEKNGKI